MPKILTSWEIIAHIDVSVTGDIRLLRLNDYGMQNKAHLRRKPTLK